MKVEGLAVLFILVLIRCLAECLESWRNSMNLLHVVEEKLGLDLKNTSSIFRKWSIIIDVLLFHLYNRVHNAYTIYLIGLL